MDEKDQILLDIFEAWVVHGVIGIEPVANGNVHNGIDEGEYYSGKFIRELKESLCKIFEQGHENG